MITRDLLIRYLEQNLGDPVYSRQGLKFNCPKCDEGHKFNLEINMEKNIFNCWSCRYSGTLRTLLKDKAVDETWRALPEFKFVAKAEDEHEKIINFPVNTIPFYMNRDVADYLTIERGINRKELINRGVRYVYTEEEIYYNHICFPFYENGKLVGACLQNFETKKYRNLSKLNFVPYKEFINPLYPVILTEGIYDGLSGINAIPLLSTEINQAVLEFIHDKDVILSLDNTIDMEHYLRQIENINKYSPRSLRIFDLQEYKDMNEFFKSDETAFLDELKNCVVG